MQYDDHIPAPPILRSGPSKIGELLRGMRPGQSFLVPSEITTSTAQSAMGNLKHKGWRFVSRTENGRLRIWCVEAPSLD